MKIGSIGQEPSRFSFVVSKKVSKRATKRNAVRRKGYRAAQNVLSSVQPGFVVLVFAKKNTEVLSQELITLELTSLFLQAGIIAN
jgi:ribonuclease P protein component